MNNKKNNIVWLDRFNEFYSMPQDVESYGIEREEAERAAKLTEKMKECLRVPSPFKSGEDIELTIDKDYDVTIGLNILKDERKFRSFKREMAAVLNTFFDGDYVKRVFNMLSEQIGAEGKKIKNLKYSTHYVANKKLIISYNVITRSEVFNNVIQLPLMAEPFEVCDE